MTYVGRRERKQGSYVEKKKKRAGCCKGIFLEDDKGLSDILPDYLTSVDQAIPE